MSVSNARTNRQGATPESLEDLLEGIQVTEPSEEGSSGLMDLLLQPFPDGVQQSSRDTGVSAGEPGCSLKEDAADAAGLVPPYAPYCSWLGLLDALAGYLPPVVDDGYLAGLKVSESSLKPLKSALRFLGLVASDGVPTERLHRLVEGLAMGGTGKVTALRHLVYYGYDGILSSGHDLKTVTMEEIRLYFAAMGARGQIQQKCSTFFLNLARDAGLDLPHYLVPPAPGVPQRRAGQVGAALEERRESATAYSRELGILLGIFPKFDIDWPEDKKQRWFRDFVKVMRIAERGEEPTVN